MEKSNTSQLLNELKKLEPVVSSKFDAAFILVHIILQDFGFKLVGLGEDGPRVEEKHLPSDWNKSTDSWAFRYRHSRSSMTFLVKGLRLQNSVLLHAFSLEQKEVHNANIDVDHYVASFDNFSLTNLEAVYKNIPDLQAKLEQSIVRKLVPSVEDLNALAGGGPPPQQQQPRPQYPHPEPRAPHYDPLRVPPTGPRYPGAPPIGGDDLFPHGAGGAYYPGAPMPGSGGNLMGPNHPYFIGGGRGTFPYPGAPPGSSGGYPEGFPPPPGARFDPYGPPGANYPGPRPDHLRPPDWDDSMFG